MSAPLPPGWTRPANPQPGEQDAGTEYLDRLEAHTTNPTLLRAIAEVRARSAPSAGQDTGQLRDEGRCSGELCWYTLPLVDGLVVAHSKAGTLDDCEGAGRPPLPPGRTHADSQMECDLAEVLHAHPGIVWSAALDLAAALLDGPLARLIVERDEARAQVQRVRELDPVEVALGGLAYVIEQMNAEHNPGT